jgi:hypothetical protein
MSEIPKQTVTIDLPYFIDIVTKCAKLEVEVEKKNDDYGRLYCENLRLKEQLKEAAK